MKDEQDLTDSSGQPSLRDLVAVRTGDSEGLRERKKRLTRQLISDTATEMFLDRGFDNVRVAEVAAACGVSEKTVYNYFPTKESLVLDREEDMARDVRLALGPGNASASPVDAVVELLTAQIRSQFADARAESRHQDTSNSCHQRNSSHLELFRRFAAMIEGTTSLRAARQDMIDRLVQAGAQAMAERAGVNPDDPEPQIAAVALLGLWRIQFEAMQKYSDGTRPEEEVPDLIIAEVRRAARLIDSGLWSFGMAVRGASGREQLKAAAEAANEARKQVISAIKQARDAWRLVADAHRRDEAAGRQRDGHHQHPSPRKSKRG